MENKKLKYGHWIYWGGWMSNHDLRIDDAVCSECGYKHPTVCWEQGDPHGIKAYNTVLNKLYKYCPKCGTRMLKEEV